MISKLQKTFIRKNWMLLLGLATAVVVAAWFATRFLMDFLYFNDPNNVDVDLKHWMTPRYIIHTYDIPRAEVFDMLQLDPKVDKGRRLGRIAKENGITMMQLTEQVREDVAQYRAQQQ